MNPESRLAVGSPVEIKSGPLAGLSGVIVLYAIISGLFVLGKTNLYPRTDDAEVFSNFIGMAPQVDGPITKLFVSDNQFVKKGDLLVEIDPRPYAYALHQAQSAQTELEGTRLRTTARKAVNAASVRNERMLNQLHHMKVSSVRPASMPWRRSSN